MNEELKVGSLRIPARAADFLTGLAFNGVLLGLFLLGELSGLFHWLETVLN